jgi:hypothetical protein
MTLSAKRILFLLLTAFVLLSACANPRSKGENLDHTLKAYGTAFRWGGINDAMRFIDPKVLATKPLTDFERQRYEQMTIVGYRVQSAAVVDQNNIATQLVLIELVNKHTQSPKTIRDVQRWRYEKESKTWLLISGLPSLDNLANGE